MKYIIKECAYTQCNQGHLYAIIQNVEHYQNFLPFCTHSSYQPIDEHSGMGILGVKYGPLTAQFSTKNTYRNPHQIDMKLHAGPFKHLNGQWLLTPVKNELKVQFTLHFLMKNWLLNQTLQSALRHVTHQQMQAFIQLAEQSIGH